MNAENSFSSNGPSPNAGRRRGRRRALWSVLLATGLLAASASAAPTQNEPAERLKQADTGKTPDVIYVPTPQPVVDKMLDLAKPKKSDLVYDLGCGDGRIVVTAAKRFGTKAVGFDVDPARVAEARENVRQNKVEHLVTIEQRDIFEVDLSPANVVTLYLLPELNVRLIPQLERLKPGSRIVSHDFDMRGIKPERVVTVRPKDAEREHLVYLWNAPLVHESSPPGDSESAPGGF